MTTKEQKAVEDAAEKYNKEKRNHLSYSYVGTFIKGAEFLSDLRNLSEPKTKAGEPSEELVWKIIETINEMDVEVSPQDTADISREIAKLLQPDVNAELLSALDKIANAPFPFNEYEKDVFVHEARRIANEAISNYEKQQ